MEITLLKKIRVRQGLTQIQLAKMAGVSVQWIARIEQGWTGISNVTRKKIAVALEVSPEEIFPEIREKKEQVLFEVLAHDREIYRKLRRKGFSIDEKNWLFEHPEDYSVYRQRLWDLAKRHNLRI